MLEGSKLIVLSLFMVQIIYVVIDRYSNIDLTPSRKFKTANTNNFYWKRTSARSTYVPFEEPVSLKLT
jgi:hypothetical protein